MLRALLLALFVVAIAHAELCKPDAQNAFKVRISIKTALGDNAFFMSYDKACESLKNRTIKKSILEQQLAESGMMPWKIIDNWFNPLANKLGFFCPFGPVLKDCRWHYAWDANEEYLFKAMVAFAMRRYSSKSTTQISNVLLCNVTDRVSFWFVVTDSSKNVTTVPGSEVEAAIRMNRNRINNAFLLSDKTLQFLKITSTLSPPVEPSTPVWLIVFGVVLCLIVAGIVFLIVSGIQKHKKKNKGSTERENLEDKVEVTLENGIPCEALDLKAGHINGVFAADDDRFTSL